VTTKDQHEKACALLQSARDFWESFPDSCAVRWLEDTAGQLLIFTGACTYCGKAVTRQAITVDHVVPLSLGGLDRLDNLTLACARCNSEKGAGVPVDVFLESQPCE